MHIRPFAPEDVAVAGEIAAALRPPHLDTPGLTLLRDVYRVSADRLCLVAQADDRNPVTGCGALWRIRGDKYRLDVMVHPRWQQQGIGGVLLAELLTAAGRQGAATVQARARDDRPTALAFLQHRGFVESHRMQRFDLDLNQVNIPALERNLQRAEVHGIRLNTLAAEQQCDPDWLQKLHALHVAVIPDWPDPDPGPADPPTSTDFLRLLESLAIVPDQLLLAKADAGMVGYCGSLGTAVHPAYGGQGIATALEARSIQRSRDQGSETICGASANPAMRAVYAKLGYQRGFAEVRLVRPMREPDIPRLPE